MLEKLIRLSEYTLSFFEDRFIGNLQLDFAIGQAVGSSGACAKTSLPPVNPDGQHAVLWEQDGSPTILGDLGDPGHHIATAINDRGEVAGNSDHPDGTKHPFVWTRQTGIHDIGKFPGAFATVAPCCDTINNRGDVVGFWFDKMGPHAFLREDKVLTDLNQLIPADSPLYLLFAGAINDAGEITGRRHEHWRDAHLCGDPERR